LFDNGSEKRGVRINVSRAVTKKKKKYGSFSEKWIRREIELGAGKKEEQGQSRKLQGIKTDCPHSEKRRASMGRDGFFRAAEKDLLFILWGGCRTPRGLRDCLCGGEDVVLAAEGGEDLALQSRIERRGGEKRP